jgi:hypothetical protein
MAPASEEYRTAMRAYRSFLRAALSYARYLRAAGRLMDPESDIDIAGLEIMLARLVTAAEGADGGGRVVPLPLQPAQRLSHAARGQLLRYQEAVFEDSRRLRIVSEALRRRARQTRAGVPYTDGGNPQTQGHRSGG